MPRIKVSKLTHERLEAASLTGRVDMSKATVHPDGSVTFELEQETLDRLLEVCADPEAALNLVLDTYFDLGRKLQ